MVGISDNCIDGITQEQLVCIVRGLENADTCTRTNGANLLIRRLVRLAECRMRNRTGSFRWQAVAMCMGA